MLCICGFGGYNIAFYHLIMHGYFKALLFFSAGLLIKSLNGLQDFRQMGGLFNYYPLISSFFIVGLFTLVGLPGTSGYFSKEFILNFLSFNSDSQFVGAYNLLLLSLICTSIYSTRLFFYVFFGTFNGSSANLKKVIDVKKELPFSIIMCLFILVVLSLFGHKIYVNYLFSFNGYLIFSSYNDNTLQSSILYSQLFSDLFSQENKLIPIFCIFFGFTIFFFYQKILPLFFKYILIHSDFFCYLKKNFFKFSLTLTFSRFFQEAWGFDSLFNFIFYTFFKKIIFFSYFIEKNICEWFGPTGFEFYYTKVLS